MRRRRVNLKAEAHLQVNGAHRCLVAIEELSSQRERLIECGAADHIVRLRQIYDVEDVVCGNGEVEVVFAGHLMRARAAEEAAATAATQASRPKAATRTAAALWAAATTASLTAVTATMPRQLRPDTEVLAQPHIGAEVRRSSPTSVGDDLLARLWRDIQAAIARGEIPNRVGSAEAGIHHRWPLVVLIVAIQVLSGGDVIGRTAIGNGEDGALNAVRQISGSEEKESVSDVMAGASVVKRNVGWTGRKIVRAGRIALHRAQQVLCFLL